MNVRTTDLDGVLLLTPKRFEDARGFFVESYSRRAFVEAGVANEFLQDNHSLSVQQGVVRGLHYQLPPFAQSKLIRVLRGAIRDVAVDIRRSSPTFGRHVVIDISARSGDQIFVPAGFAHGFAYYSPAHDRGILWNDPALGIDWGIDLLTAQLSDKDRKHPTLAAASDLFA
jgi:dTDP-4-dehydrorhamnose 3,5-epimerase